MTVTVAIYLFPEVEVLDFAGPYEVFTTASRVFRRLHPGAPAPFEVFTVARGLEPVRARAGLVVMPDGTLTSHPDIQVLIIPGGVVGEELAQPELMRWITDRASTAVITASVCTGAFLLARAGLLAGCQVTTHWEDVADLRSQFPDLEVRAGVRWIDEGRIVTSAGISAGIDMSLHLVARLAGRELACLTARQMDFAWTENPELPGQLAG